MRSQEFIQEKSPDYRQRDAAMQEIEKIRYSPDIKSWDQYTPEMLKRVIELSKITGRAMKMSRGYRETVGQFIDSIKVEQLNTQKKSGQLPEFSGRASTAREMARQIAAYTNGEYDVGIGRSWTTGRGQRYKDPSDFVVYRDQNSYDDAMQWIEGRSKKVHYRDHSGDITTAMQLGKYIVQPATTILGPFTDNPKTTHRVSVRSAGVVNQGGRSRVDITDQQAAALRDIAQTKNANSMQLIQSMMAVMQGQDDVKQIIAQSQKITPQDKAKLDRIIAGAADFKEPQ